MNSLKYLLLYVTALGAMESSSSSGSDSSTITVHKLPRLNTEFLASTLAIIHEGVELQDFSDIEIGFSRVHSKINVIDSDEYLDHIQQQSEMIRNFLNQHAKDGSTYRKCIEKAFSESESGSSDSNLHRPRSLSKTKFDELLAILGKAANQLEDKHKKKDKENKLLKKIIVGSTACGAATGACLAAFCATTVTAIIAYVINL